MSASGSDEQDSLDMRRLMEGHEVALNDLMTRHSERLFHYLIRQLQNEADAADVVEETFVRIYQHQQSTTPRNGSRRGCTPSRQTS